MVHWISPEAGIEAALSAENFPIIEIEMRSSGDVNRHSSANVAAVSKLAVDFKIHLVELFQEPFSRATDQICWWRPGIIETGDARVDGAIGEVTAHIFMTREFFENMPSRVSAMIEMHAESGNHDSLPDRPWTVPRDEDNE